VKVHIAKDAQQLFLDAAQFMVERAAACLREKGFCTIALSGGNTPKHLYKVIVDTFRNALDWNRIYFFLSDERFVPLTDPASNGGQAKALLIDPLGIHENNVYYVPTFLPSAIEAADQYQQAIESFFMAKGQRQPVFDLILLGLGADGHTASLFPGSAALDEKFKYVTGNWVEQFKTWRITFTYPLINAAAHVLFLVQGSKKAGVLAEIINNRNVSLSARFVQPASGKLYWYADREAGEFLLKDKEK
jgi:6-phosphogluconolactonase